MRKDLLVCDVCEKEVTHEGYEYVHMSFRYYLKLKKIPEGSVAQKTLDVCPDCIDKIPEMIKASRAEVEERACKEGGKPSLVPLQPGQCVECGKVFETDEILFKHLVDEHGIQEYAMLSPTKRV